ncbi:polyphosphate kinase 1 [Pannus brasiliensis CCIBt3594]|uniref:Polyphosphate kinase n=1 Tax=Pannus brasiliensis CCIBt3594 TaxID=1427578 RepID=A0AAW9QL30_9CHRO
MTTVSTVIPEINLKDPRYYFNRELSWLEFNKRVLSEALDPRTPLLERLKFTAIFCSNLDEFFMVRVAVLKQQVEANVTTLSPDGRTPSEQIAEIGKRLRVSIEQQDRLFEYTLRPQLAEHGIHLIDYVDLGQEQRTYLHDYFDRVIFPVLTPLAVDPSHPFPYISNLSLNLAVVVRDPDTDKELFARVKVPQVFPRFVALPKELRQNDGKASIWTGVPLEQVVAHNLEALFPGMIIQECYPFRVTRNADISVEEDEADDLLLAIQEEVRKRRVGKSAVRLEIDRSTPENIKERIREDLGLESIDVYDVEGLLGHKDLFYFLSLPCPDLKDPPWNPVTPPALEGLREIVDGNEDGIVEQEGEDIFTLIRSGDILVHHPYHSFSASVQQFIAQAGHDPHVLAIKMTLYRTSGDSPIVNALIAAAENGKQVAALVELKARFDEENNITWARKLEQAGVHVVYGLVGLKTHTKIVLVVRQEGEKIRRYVHIGTGNYNPKTAKSYTDLGLLSCREDLGADITDLFNFLTGYSRQQSYRKLLVAPVSMRKRMLEMIRRETENCRNGGTGRIVAKMNALVDPKIIEALYDASRAGVKIDLIVRGMCCLRPGLPEVSENIRVISIIGRFLEHSRIFYFYNGGADEVYIGSADWMTRNLSRRVEAIAPIDDPAIAKELEEILGIMLSDNRQAWDLQPDGSYIQRRPAEGEQEHGTQTILMEKALTSAGIV